MMIRQILLAFQFFYFSQCKNLPPAILEQPQDLIAELDKPMAIHCRAESSSLDDLTIDWYKDGRLVTMDPHARIITEFMALHVINAMPQDAGVYYCIAKNSFGQTQSRKARIQFLKLEKEFPVSPTSMTVSIGDRVHLRCQPPSGLPTPIVYWTKDGKNVSLSLNHYDLIISSIQQTDFGSYRCNAFNGLLRQSSPAYLTEFHRPKLSILPSNSRIDLRRGQTIQLKCEIDNDQYELEWHYQNHIIRNHSIEISSIDFDQSGIYQCLARLDSHIFRQDILLAVYDREIRNNDEKIFSQTNLTVYLGQRAILDCQLPLISEKMTSWRIQNQSDIQYEFLDTNHSRLQIARIEKSHQNLIFECSYDNSSEGLIRLNVEQLSPPPIISYIPNNQTVPIGVEVVFSCQSNEEITTQWWFIPFNRPSRLIRLDNDRKFRIKTNHDLIIRHVDKYDAGKYKCISTNLRNDQTIYIGHLHVEDARSNRIFHRVESQDLPQAPSQPIVVRIESEAIELTWTHPSNDILGYLIEYFQVTSSEKNFQWERIFVKNADNRQRIENLKANSIYQFLVRAKNLAGYGLPSILSELIETKPLVISNTNFIHLSNPTQFDGTRVTIQWSFLRNHSSIQQITIYIRNKNDNLERIETISNSLINYTIENLRPNTAYLIYLVCSIDSINYSSNKISFRTLESSPSSSPRNIHIELITTTSLSIQWNSPLENETNGEILAYKINCLNANESHSIRLDNISTDAKGLVIKNLIENTEYCISIAARTRIGFGPYSSPICVTMNEKFLHLNRNSLTYRLREAISQPWFLPVIILFSILFTCAFSYGLWLCFHYLTQRHRLRIKFHNSASTSNQSVELPIHKTLSNGKRYDLIQDTLPLPPLPSPRTAVWMNSNSNTMRLQCCTTASVSSNNNEHYTMNIHKNPINSLLLESRQQQLNPYATTGIFQPTSSMYFNEKRSIESETIHSAQYQLPWFDHHPSSTLQSRSQSMTPYTCQHCTSQSHPHTPQSIRTTLRSPSIHRKINEIKQVNSPIIKHLSNDIPSNSIMMNSLGAETLTTSCSNSTDENLSSDRNTPKTTNQSSSEGSIFSDTDIPQQDDAHHSSLVNFERGPSFLIPNTS